MVSNLRLRPTHATVSHVPGRERVPLVGPPAFALDGQLGSVWVAWLSDGHRQHERDCVER